MQTIFRGVLKFLKYLKAAHSKVLLTAYTIFPEFEWNPIREHINSNIPFVCQPHFWCTFNANLECISLLTQNIRIFPCRRSAHELAMKGIKIKLGCMMQTEFFVHFTHVHHWIEAGEKMKMILCKIVLQKFCQTDTQPPKLTLKKTVFGEKLIKWRDDKTFFPIPMSFQQWFWIFRSLCWQNLRITVVAVNGKSLFYLLVCT